MNTRLGINIDHVATVRQARKEFSPDPVALAHAALEGGADGITAHLREDRRHIQDADVFRLSKLSAPLNLEMALDPSVLDVALAARPAWTCLVPERRQELTTEGGLNVATNGSALGKVIETLRRASIQVSLFIEPELDAVRMAKELGATAVELHTGKYARFFSKHLKSELEEEKRKIVLAAEEAARKGLIVNAGHGLDYQNVTELTQAFSFNEFNIGFAVVCRALVVGMKQAVSEMKERINQPTCVES